MSQAERTFKSVSITVPPPVWKHFEALKAEGFNISRWVTKLIEREMVKKEKKTK